MRRRCRMRYDLRMRWLFFASWIAACASPPATSDAGRDAGSMDAGAFDAGSDAGEPKDAGDAGEIKDAELDASGCAAACDDGNPCTDDLCAGFECTFVANDAEC